MMNFPSYDRFETNGHSYRIDRTHTALGGNREGVGRQISTVRKMAPYDPEKQELRGDSEMPGKVDEGKWSDAKAAAKKQYPDWSDDNPRLWKVTSAIYKKMGGKFSAKMKKSLEFMETIERTTPSFVRDHRIWLRALKKSGSSLTKPETILANIGLTLRFYADMGGGLQKSSMLESLQDQTARNIGDQFQKALPGAVAATHAYSDRKAKPGGGYKYTYKQPGRASPGAPKPPLPAPKRPQGGEARAQGFARIVEKLAQKDARAQKQALQNVSYENLSALHDHLPAKSSLKALVSQQMESRKQESVKTQAAAKEKTTEKSQGDREFNSFAEKNYEEVRKSLSTSHPEWDHEVLVGRVQAQLKHLFKYARR